MAFSFTSKGSYKRTREWLRKMANDDFDGLRKYGQMGVDALRSNTPKDSGQTANSWGYSVERTSNGYELRFNNTNIQGNVNIAVILQYGHGTGTGGYVQGRDYINPAIQPVFDKIAREAWREVMNR